MAETDIKNKRIFCRNSDPDLFCQTGPLKGAFLDESISNENFEPEFQRTCKRCTCYLKTEHQITGAMML